MTSRLGLLAVRFPPPERKEKEKDVGSEMVELSVRWGTMELNLNRKGNEAVGGFLRRLSANIEKKHQSKKQNTKKSKKDSMSQNSNANESTCEALELALVLGDETRSTVPNDCTLKEALCTAKYLRVGGALLEIHTEPPMVHVLKLAGAVMKSHPVAPVARCTNCTPEDITVEWYRLPLAPSTGGGKRLAVPSMSSLPSDAKLLHVGTRYVPIAEDVGYVLAAKAYHPKFPELAKAQECAQPVEDGPSVGGWERRLATFARHVGGGGEDGSLLRVASFNVLATKHALTDLAKYRLYPYCDMRFLKTEYRRPLLLRELLDLDCDILCLQECERPFFRNFLEPCLAAEYIGLLKVKAGLGHEGCAMFVRRDAFDVVEVRDVGFQQVFTRWPVFSRALNEFRVKWPRFENEVLPKLTTVFQVVVLRSRHTGHVIISVNTHLFFHPHASHIRMLQIWALFEYVAALRKKLGGQEVGVIMSGDFNTMPSSGAYELLRDKRVSSTHPHWDYGTVFVWEKEEEVKGDEEEEDVDEELETEVDPKSLEYDGLGDMNGQDDTGVEEGNVGEEVGLSEGLGVDIRLPECLHDLRDTYSDTPLPFSNSVNGFEETLDYILVSEGFRIRRVLPEVTREDLQPHVGLPAVNYASDHISIAVELEVPR